MPDSAAEALEDIRLEEARAYNEIFEEVEDE